MRETGWWRISIAFVLVAGYASVTAAQWVVFSEETATRLSVADPDLVVDDPEEKNYAWADFDDDGDIDVVIFRKEPFLVAGKLRNILLINENGVLTDRTSEFAVASDVAGDQGFLTPTNDRDVVVVDVDLDGWLDLVTATTISPGEPKHVGHPRVYMNLGCDGDCNGTEDWLGFEYQDARIPAMLSATGQSGFNPCFCDVSAGDVTGDGYPDLWFTDYDAGCSSPASDFQSRLLINQGLANPGHFLDETDERFFGLVGGQPFPVNIDSLSGAIADLNNDGTAEVILESEGIIDIAYTEAGSDGTWETYDTLNAFATYFLDVSDLNNDGQIDFIATDDGADRYFMHQGLGDDDMANFLSFVYQYSHTGAGGPAGDDGFGDETVAVDLDNDGWLDVLTFDVDFEFSGCQRRAHIYKNQGGEPGDNVVLTEQTTGSGCQNLFGNPPTCLVASIPANELVGTYDIAVFDINGDGWDDLIVGRCSGTAVYMNVPASGAAGSTPDGALIEGAMLTVARDGEQISLSWGASCSPLDDDYSVYYGTIGGTFEDHIPLLCSTGGLTAVTVPDSPGAGIYYLVAPRNPEFTGSLGANSLAFERSIGPSPCTQQLLGACQ